MEYLRLLYELPAIVSGCTMLAYLLPVKFEIRFAPLLMFVVALLVLWMPEFVDLALCLTIPATYFQENILGIKMDGHEPLKLTVPKVKLPKRAKPVPIQEFATQAYPDPAAEPEDDEHSDDDPPKLEPPTVISTVKSFVPPL
jgi:hypothetical protein